MSVILTEHLSFNQAKLVVEAKGDDPTGKKLYMSGIFIQGGVRNLNERVYPVDEITKAVEHINKQINDGYSICGECDHPEDLTINLDRISHVISNMWMEGNAGCGRLQILPTEKGNLIRTLIECGVKLGVSSRGSGDVNDRGEVSNFEISTVDIVARPSAPNAFPKPVYESRNSKRGPIIEDLARAVSYDPKAQKFLAKELLEWINNLK